MLNSMLSPGILEYIYIYMQVLFVFTDEIVGNFKWKTFVSKIYQHTVTSPFLMRLYYVA